MLAMLRAEIKPQPILSQQSIIVNVLTEPIEDIVRQLMHRGILNPQIANHPTFSKINSASFAYPLITREVIIKFLRFEWETTDGNGQTVATPATPIRDTTLPNCDYVIGNNADQRGVIGEIGSGSRAAAVREFLSLLALDPDPGIIGRSCAVLGEYRQNSEPGKQEILTYLDHRGNPKQTLGRILLVSDMRDSHFSFGWNYPVVVASESATINKTQPQTQQQTAAGQRAR